MNENKMLESQGIDSNGAIDGFKALSQVIGKEQVQNATTILNKYREGKKNLETKVVENEQWYKVRHWECMQKTNKEIEPSSAWLFNCIANKHADAMDNFPAPNILPREETDKAEASKLSSIIPVILDQNDFEKTYSDVWWYKLKTGTGVYGVFWDKDKLNGLGDISIKKIDLLNLFWQPGITDIQSSRNLFHVELVDNDVLLGSYPQLSNKLGKSLITIQEYVYDDTVDTSDKSAVVDWYYKKNVNGKTVLHYCKFVNDEVLFATENTPEFAERGLYDHAKYPFVFDVLFPIESTPTGFGYIDIGKSPQSYIDRIDACILKNALVNAKPRFFINESGSVNEEEFANMNNDFVHVKGSTLGTDSILAINSTGLSNIYVETLNNKIEELKETTGNRDVSTGGTNGVTAASGIAAMQEAGSKLSRDGNKQSYRSYREMILLVVELIRQFYDLPRCFRIMGQSGVAEFITYTNNNIQPQMLPAELGMAEGMRKPLFDIEVSAEKQSPYSKMAQNELALQFYGAGFFNPQISDQALACLEMMDFDRKEFIMQRIAQNGALYRQILMQQMMMQPQMTPNEEPPKAEKTEALGGNSKDESSVTKNARERVAEGTSPT